MSSLPRNMGWPLINCTAASVDTRVLVLRLLNIMATVLPLRAPSSGFGGCSPAAKAAFTAALWEEALRTSLVNSAGVRSAMDRRCLGPEALESERVWREAMVDLKVRQALRENMAVKTRSFSEGGFGLGIRNVQGSGFAGLGMRLGTRLGIPDSTNVS